MFISIQKLFNVEFCLGLENENLRIWYRDLTVIINKAVQSKNILSYNIHFLNITYFK